MLNFWVPVSLGLSVLCFASIAFQYYTDIIPMYFGVYLFFYLFLLFVSQPDFNKKSLLLLLATLLNMLVILLKLGM